MKSDERHELKSNELQKLTARVRPYVERYGLHALLGVAAVVVVAAGAMYFTRSSAATKAAGWTEVISANSAEKLLEVAETESLSQKPVAAWARLQAGERYLEAGIRASLQNREGERGLVSDLDEARKCFEQVLEVAPAKSEMQERALYGLGRTLETMAGVNQPTDARNATTADLLDEAAKAYKKLVDEYPKSPYNQKRFEDEEVGRLERHLNYLKTEEAREFYAWFRTQTPKAKDRQSPFDGSPFGGGLPSGHPPLDSGPPTLPDIPDGLRLPEDDAGAGPSFPGTPEKPDGGAGDEETPAAKPPANEDGAAGDDASPPASPPAQPDAKDGES